MKIWKRLKLSIFSAIQIWKIRQKATRSVAVRLLDMKNQAVKDTSIPIDQIPEIVAQRASLLRKTISDEVDSQVKEILQFVESEYKK